MRLVLDVEDSKVEFMMNLLKEFSFVKTSKMYEEPEDLVSNLAEAVEEMKLIKKGELKGLDLKDVLDEL